MPRKPEKFGRRIEMNRKRNRRYYLRKTNRWVEEVEETEMLVKDAERVLKGGRMKRLGRLFNVCANKNFENE